MTEQHKDGREEYAAEADEDQEERVPGTLVDPWTWLRGRLNKSAPPVLGHSVDLNPKEET